MTEPPEEEPAMTEQQQADVIVIGLGPGGEHAAGRLAEAGLDVVGIEAELVGGECPYWGCVPSKMMIRAGNLLAEARRVPGIAGTSQVTPDWAEVAARIRDEATDDWNDQVAVDRLTGKGGRFIRGRARLTGPGRVTVDDLAITARRGIVIATGTRPTAPPVPGLADVPYWTNRDAIAAKELHESLLVLGGGAIGLELAQVFARFGTTVTVVEAMDRILPADEPEAGRLIGEVLEREGIGIRTDARAVRAEHDGVTFTLHLEGGEQLSAERLLVATGRRADLTGLGLDTIGLDPAARAIITDGRMRAADGLWAIGDVTGHGAFTHVAMYEAEIAVRDILGAPGPDADYRALPRVTFTDPEIGAVGLTEHQARDKGLSVRTGTAELPSSARGWIHKAGNEGFVKLVEDADRGILVGATSAGPAGGEVLYGLAVAIQAEVPTERLRHMIYAYPTFHRAVETALADLH
ncbi:NAD(P)/FAD-dependent oxidoreductase [Streptomyces sp. NPDC006984]|uniref:dihydrolipoyl dehydrogenase family protein n=1 Tax=Streptomyces sp. NPDC006984 TaxID=3155463 RepID=UPI0033C3ED6A